MPAVKLKVVLVETLNVMVAAGVPAYKPLSVSDMLSVNLTFCSPDLLTIELFPRIWRKVTSSFSIVVEFSAIEADCPSEVFAENV